MVRFKQLRCSFCRKKDSEVLKLVAGRGVYICDACVAIATRLMNNPSTDDQSSSLQSSVWHKFITQVAQVLRGHNALRAWR